LKNSRNASLILAVLAAALYILLFFLHRLGPLDFWWWMSADIIVLVSLSFALDRSFLTLRSGTCRREAWKQVLLGVFSAVVLYFIFYVGNSVSRLVFPFAAGGIQNVYSFREGASPLRITLLILLLIGPGEELFWRGFIQRGWQNRFGPLIGWILASGLYSLVHVGSGNIMLILAALICGLFWGGLYLRCRSLLLVAVSHTLWDILIFVLFPLEKGLSP